MRRTFAGLFEDANPDDRRPRLALESLHAWIRGELSMVECRTAAFAAHAAARDAVEPAAIAAARATGQACAVAHMWNHCSHAADYAAKAVMLGSSDDPSAKQREREWQWEQLREDLRELGFPKGE
ncbi:putative immunity protein [Rhodococcus sp. MALMAid1271]|uniref:putative immunity protein n=1 Tax=Rhodococcus sp. MALMAid1271 TaxID=3411744 RepID=UPI003B9F375F